MCSACLGRGIPNYVQVARCRGEVIRDETKNATDPVLRLVPEERRGPLMAHASAAAPARFEWNVKLQGPDETVFFAC